jgi:hypothetical protein
MITTAYPGEVENLAGYAVVVFQKGVIFPELSRAITGEGSVTL